MRARQRLQIAIPTPEPGGEVLPSGRAMRSEQAANEVKPLLVGVKEATKSLGIGYNGVYDLLNSGAVASVSSPTDPVPAALTWRLGSAAASCLPLGDTCGRHAALGSSDAQFLPAFSRDLSADLLKDALFLRRELDIVPHVLPLLLLGLATLFEPGWVLGNR
jgi:hypothetical protein